MYAAAHSAVAVSSAAILRCSASAADAVTDVTEAPAQCAVSVAKLYTGRRWHFFLVRAVLESFELFYTHCALCGFVSLCLLSLGCLAVLEPCCKWLMNKRCKVKGPHVLAAKYFAVDFRFRATVG